MDDIGLDACTDYMARKHGTPAVGSHPRTRRGNCCRHDCEDDSRPRRTLIFNIPHADNISTNHSSSVWSKRSQLHICIHNLCHFVYRPKHRNRNILSSNSNFAMSKGDVSHYHSISVGLQLCVVANGYVLEVDQVFTYKTNKASTTFVFLPSGLCGDARQGTTEETTTYFFTERLSVKCHRFVGNPVEFFFYKTNTKFPLS